VLGAWSTSFDLARLLGTDWLSGAERRGPLAQTDSQPVVRAGYTVCMGSLRLFTEQIL
jgi:hypothetical protein